MQQTEKYKLNLIESSDPFLPDALNANTQKIEAAMIAHEADVEGRLVALEDRRICAGYQDHVTANKIVPLPFTPSALLIVGGSIACLTVGGPDGGSSNINVVIAENGFFFRADLFNGHWYTFLAFS